MGCVSECRLLQIAQELGNSHTTISREVLKRRTDRDKGAFGRVTNRCIFRRNCDVYYLCPDEHKCVLRKKFYHHSPAQQEYRHVLVKSRAGANLTETKRLEISNEIHAGTQKGQSVHHMMSTNKDSFTVCEKTVYRYVNAGIIRAIQGILQHETAQTKAFGTQGRHKMPDQ